MVVMHRCPTHEDLLTLARKVEAAAQDGDRDRLQTADLRLFEALVDHLGREMAALVQLPPAQARILRQGQQRIVDTVVDLAARAALSGDCDCESVAQDLMAELELQAHDERLHLPVVA